MKANNIFYRYFKHRVLSLFCRLRCLGLPVIIIDSSVHWTLISYRELFIRFLMRGRILVELQDVQNWEWVIKSRDERVNLCTLPDSVIYGICDTFQVLPWEFDQLDKLEYEKTKEKFRAGFNRAYSSLHFINKRLRIEKVVYAQGYVTGADACRQFSLRSGIGRLAIENVANKNKILWENISGISVNKTLAKNYYFGYKGVFSRDFLRKHLVQKLKKIRESKLDEHKSGDKKTDAVGYVLFLGQVYTDTSILFSAKEGWAPIDVIQQLVHETHNLGLELYVKLHPKEKNGKSSLARVAYDSLTYKKMQEVAGLVDACALIDSDNILDTYDLIENAKAVVTLNSQAGLEAALFGKPVVCCAQSNYSELGFTFECTHQTNLRTALNQALSCDSETCQSIAIKAAEYDYIFNEIYCIEKSATKLRSKCLRRT